MASRPMMVPQRGGTFLARLRVVALVVALAAATSPAAAQEASAEAQVLVVLQGTVATVEDEVMTVTTPPVALMFTDRPHRIVRPIVLQTYVDTAWTGDAAMRQVPPNAVLVDETGAEIAIIEIYELGYDGTDLRMTFAILDGDAPPTGALVALTIDEVDEQITDNVQQTLR